MTDQDTNVSLSEITGTLATRGYNLIRKLGEGTYAKVYLASYVPVNDPNRKSLLACKVVDTAKAPKDFVRKFLPRELDILMKLNHPHIVHVHSIFQRRSKYYIFMRLAEKGDLLDWVLRHGAVAEGQSRVWLRQLSLAIQYLQALDVAHRDLKCENVLITANYNAKLADFGFARYVVDSRGRRVLSGTNCGSLSYAAPEILRGEHYDPRISDIWSLGVVLYIMLNKAMPFDDTNINRLYEEQVHRRWKFCSNVADTLSDQVKDLIRNMLEPETQKRCQVEQILASDWLAMDPRLATNSTAESTALNAAIEDRNRRYAGQRRDAVEQSRNEYTVSTLPTSVASQVGESHEDHETHGTPDQTEDPGGQRRSTMTETLVEMGFHEVAEVASTVPHPMPQPSRGAISIMEHEPVKVTQPPHFLPPDLSQILTSKASGLQLPNNLPSCALSHNSRVNDTPVLDQENVDMPKLAQERVDIPKLAQEIVEMPKLDLATVDKLKQAQERLEMPGPAHSTKNESEDLPDGVSSTRPEAPDKQMQETQ